MQGGDRIGIVGYNPGVKGYSGFELEKKYSRVVKPLNPYALTPICATHNPQVFLHHNIELVAFVVGQIPSSFTSSEVQLGYLWYDEQPNNALAPGAYTHVLFCCYRDYVNRVTLPNLSALSTRFQECLNTNDARRRHWIPGADQLERSVSSRFTAFAWNSTTTRFRSELDNPNFSTLRIFGYQDRVPSNLADLPELFQRTYFKFHQDFDTPNVAIRPGDLVLNNDIIDVNSFVARGNNFSSIIMGWGDGPQSSKNCYDVMYRYLMSETDLMSLGSIQRALYGASDSRDIAPLTTVICARSLR